nr:hypothetical protein [Entomoplasma sp. MP1]
MDLQQEYLLLHHKKLRQKAREVFLKTLLFKFKNYHLWENYINSKDESVKSNFLLNKIQQNF